MRVTQYSTLAVLDSPGVGEYPGHQHSVTHTGGVDTPALTVLQPTHLHLLGLVVLLTQGTDYGPFLIHHLDRRWVKVAE